MTVIWRAGMSALALFAIALPVLGEEQTRRIEEIIVTAEKRQSTVSDTSISITAIGAEMLEDLGIQSANEFVNFIPATTRDDYDIRIRGVGRNFRSLGGDPGVSTYYNGVYSEDALIALTENALWDLERIEVLRGPQGTLYGRNSIGGAINYISKKPTDAWSGTVRMQLGRWNTNEAYAAVSGPIIEDVLKFRMTGAKQQRDGAQEGQFGTQDADEVNDQNLSLAFEWTASDTVTVETRFNDRRSLRRNGTSALINQGWGDNRGSRGTDLYAFGVRPVAEGTSGASMFTNPITGATAWGASIRPGVDAAASSFPNEAYMSHDYLNGNGDPDRAEPEILSNNENQEEFDQQAVMLAVSWDINDQTSLKYIFGYNDFLYYFDIDGDHSNSNISDPNARVYEEMHNFSHELQVLWNVGDNLEMTTGLYWFDSNRLQDFGFNNRRSQNRLQMAADYGLFDDPNPLLGYATFFQFIGTSFAIPTVLTPHVGLGDAPIGQTISGLWGGDPQYVYHHKNKNNAVQKAFFSQGTYTFNENWALTLGVRWAEDEKTVFENRGGMFESDFPISSFRAFFDIPGMFAGGLGQPGYFEMSGLTDLALVNVLAGRATVNPFQYTDDAITPVCDLTDPNCATPLLLQGLPFSWTGRAEDKQTWDAVTWRANVDWTPNDSTLVYFGATTGYRSGGYGLGIADARVGPPTALKPLSYDEEEVIAIELGYKAQFRDDTLQVNASIYRYDYEGYQDSVVVYDETQNAFRDIPTNTGDAVNQGFEIEVVWLATDNLTLNANYSYTDTEYQDNVYFLEDDDHRRPEALFPSTPDPADVEATLGPFNAKGSSLKGIPEHKGVMWGTYKWNTEVGSFFVLGTVSYTGEYYPNGLERDFDMVESRTRTDVSLIWESLDRKRRIRFFVDNVFDEVMYRGFGTGGAGNNYKFTGSMLGTRFWGIDARWEFGDG